jgi:HTH-type transcriptional regulator/antitoxin HigA
MKTARKSKLRFADMPHDYVALCRVHLPRPIHDKTEYENTLAVAEVFAGFENKMTAEQEDYFDLLCTLIEAWESATVKGQPVTALDMLRHLVEEHEMSGADLSRALGGSRQLGSMILRGERSITAEHARKLGKRFGLPAGVFIE